MADQFTALIEAKLDISQAQKAWASFKSQMESTPLKVKVDISDFNKQAKSVSNAYKTALQRQIETVAKTQRNAFSQPLGNMTKSEFSYVNWWNKQISLMEKPQKELEKKLSEIKTSFSRIVSYDLNRYSNTNGYNKIIDSLDRAKKAKQELDKEMAKGSDANLDIINSDLKKITSELKKADTQWDRLNSTANQLENIRAGNATLTWLKNNDRAAKDYGETLTKLANLQKNASTVGELENYTRQVRKIQSEAQALGKTGNSFWTEVKRGFTQIGQFVGVYGVLQQIPQAFSQMVTEVFRVDEAMTNLQMATGVSDNQAKELMNTYAQLGDQLKATSVDVAASSTEWLKQGQSIEDSLKLAEYSTILSKIGNLSIEDATSTITAAMKSYGLGIDNVMGFIDQISAIDMASATDVGGLATAFNEVAANARNAGVEEEKVLAYAAAIGETTQEGMASVGTSLNAIFSRMGNIKLSRLTDPETNEDLSNVETSLRNVGIELRESTGEFRDFDNVIDEVANNWDNYSEVTQRSIASSFAGQHHINDFMVLMQNYDNALQYMQTAQESSGTSMEKYEAYTTSLAGKIEGLKNSFQALSTATVNSDLFGTLIEGATGLSNVLTGLIDQFGAIPTIMGIVGGGFASKKGFGKQYRSFNAPFYKIA